MLEKIVQSELTAEQLEKLENVLYINFHDKKVIED